MAAGDSAESAGRGERSGAAGSSEAEAGMAGAYDGRGVGGRSASTVGGAPARGGGSGAAGGEGGATAGRAAAGATAGRTAAGAMGGQPGDAALPLPEGCEPRGRTEDETSCSLGMFCGSTPNIANCTKLPSGSWRCQCDLGGRERVYELVGVPGIRACAIAGGLCSIDDLTLDDETCEPAAAQSGSDDCQLELACRRSIEVPFAPETTAWLTRYATASCEREVGGVPFDCACSSKAGEREYEVIAADGAAACRPLAQFCLDTTEPVFDGPLECFPSDFAPGSNGCELSRNCGSTIALKDDVRVGELEGQYVNCEPSGNGSRCYCSTPTESFQFEVDQQPNPETCSAFISGCAPDAAIEATGEPSCMPTSQQTGLDWCSADLDCRVPATVDGKAVVAIGRLLVQCARTESGEPWWCSCASNQTAVTFELGSAVSSAWETCTRAPAACLEHMPVFVGPYGEFMPPPDPTPLTP